MPFLCGIKISVHCSALYGFVTEHMCDRRMDGQNYDAQDGASIVASHGQNEEDVTAFRLLSDELVIAL